MLEASIQFVKRKDGVKLAYSAFGKGQPFVVPPPWVTSLSFFLEDSITRQFWNQLSQAVRVVIYDKHGCGQSDRDRKEYTLESELLDLETIIEHLGLRDFILFGSSMAGPISIAYTARYPERVTRLILYGAYSSGKKLATEEVESALVSLVHASWGLGSKALADIFLPEANPEELHSVAKFQRASCSPEVAARILGLCFSFDVSEILSSISIPTLILHREGDKAISVQHGRQLAGEVPNARFKVLKGKFHPPWYGDTYETVKDIVEFLGESELKKPPIVDLAVEEPETAEQATIVFSDIVSSTDLVTKLGDRAARDIFLKHDQLVRKQLKKYGGRELQNLGDGFMLSFKSTSAAIKCACDIQREISNKLASIKVRIGVNTGEVVRREGEHPFGQAVVLASRILSRAKGEQILVSDVTKQLASGGAFPFLERGRFKPKGFKETMKMYEVQWKG